jgi:hypothetical protein
MGATSDRYEEADRAFRVGEVLTDDKQKLIEHLHGLSNTTNINNGTQHRDIIRSLTINHILLHRHIETLQDQVNKLHDHITTLNTGNTKIQKWVIALAVAALISTVIQTAVAIRSELRSTPLTQADPAPQKKPEPKAVAPSQVLPLSSDQPTKKTP